MLADADDGLDGGAWVLRGNIQVWVPDDPKAWQLERRELRIVDLIACPACRAKVTEPCRTKSGHTTTAHSCRLTPRLCNCGALLEVQRRLCDTCRDETNRANKRDHLRRLRAAMKEAA